jgi:hypothetical protein
LVAPCYHCDSNFIQEIAISLFICTDNLQLNLLMLCAKLLTHHKGIHKAKARMPEGFWQGIGDASCQERRRTFVLQAPSRCGALYTLKIILFFRYRGNSFLDKQKPYRWLCHAAFLTKWVLFTIQRHDLLMGHYAPLSRVRPAFWSESQGRGSLCAFYLSDYFLFINYPVFYQIGFLNKKDIVTITPFALPIASSRLF